MIRPSRRVENIKEYYFSKKLREIAELRAQGVDIISLGVGGPDLPPPAEVVDTLCEAVHNPANHGYQPHVGIAELRQAFADWYRKSYGVELNPKNEIQPLIGSKEGVTHISLAFLNPGDKVLVPNPGYPTYTSISKMAGAEPVFYDLTEEGGWQPDFEAIEKMDLDGVKLMWLNYPHMPTGASARMETFEKAIDFGKRHGIVIVHDNPYSFILHWRVGVAVSNPTILSWILRIKSNIDSGQFKPVMLAAAKALAQGQDWHDDLNKAYSARRKVAEKIMTALGCTFDPSQTGLFLWGRITDPDTGSEALADRILDEARVFITPGFIFGSNGDRYIRLSLCAPEEKLNEALARINKALNQNTQD